MTRPTIASYRASRRAFLGDALRLGAGLGALPLAAACTATGTPPPTPAPAPSAPPATGVSPVPTVGPRAVVFGTNAGGSAMGLVTSVVKRHGLDLAHGVDLDLKPFDPADGEKAVVIGTLEVGIFVPVSWAIVNHEGQDISFLAPIYRNHGALLVRADAPYQQMADLRGKKIATLGQISGLYTSMQVLMREMGLDWEKDFDLVSGPAPAVVAALERGDVEAAVPFEPNSSLLLAGGKYRELLNPNEAWRAITGSPLFLVGLAARQRWIDQNPDTARAVKATILDATRYIREHPDVFEEEREALGIQSDAHLALVKQRMADVYLPEQDAALVRSIEEIVDRSVDLGIVPAKPNKDLFVRL
jgi:ABC-type nitrate/sulfonate/bicarbonate transport system substrate-binding protein